MLKSKIRLMVVGLFALGTVSSYAYPGDISGRWSGKLDPDPNASFGSCDVSFDLTQTAEHLSFSHGSIRCPEFAFNYADQIFPLVGGRYVIEGNDVGYPFGAIPLRTSLSAVQFPGRFLSIVFWEGFANGVLDIWFTVWLPEKSENIRLYGAIGKS